MTREELVKAFNPNDPGSTDSGIYGLPFSCEQSDVVIVPVPWEATVSYRAGAADGPTAVLNASYQMDLNHYDYPGLWKRGVALDEFPGKLRVQSDKARTHSLRIIEAMEAGKDPKNDINYRADYDAVNEACELMNNWVEERTSYWLGKGKMVGLLGGDHSTPLGYLRALRKIHPQFGMLVVDAHMDLRKAYEGFTYSHASVFYNALQMDEVTQMVQVGIRDFCKEEHDFAQAQGERLKVYFDRLLQREAMRGTSWHQLFDYVIARLPKKVYVSVDIDGLNPALCPNTGTPVPGGLEYEQLIYLLFRLGQSDREVIGFDLCEVAPGGDDWDGNVGSRVLYQLCGMALKAGKKQA